VPNVTKARFSVAAAALAGLAAALLAGAAPAKTITGTAQADALRGTAAADVVYGKGGNDKLYGLAGNDRLHGGAGDDVLVGGAGADRLSCGPGRDTARADPRDTVRADCEVVKGIRKPPSLPGRRVDVGGYRLYLECSGSGSPTVVIEQGQPAIPPRVLRSLQAPLAEETRVCWYDRAGVGASDRRPAGLAPTGARLSSELHTLLANANVPGPYVVAGGSFGGLLSVSHAIRYPAEFVGFVFVDAQTPWEIAPGAGDIDVPEPVHLSGELGELQAVQFGSRPVLALVSEFPGGSELARRSSNRMVASTTVGHFIFSAAPQLAVAAIRLVATAVRDGKPLPPCERTTLPALGAKCEPAG
jgi:hemolysin type calcium-binding protein